MARLHGRLRSAGQGNHRASLVQVFRGLNVTFGVLRKKRNAPADPARRLGNDASLFGQLAEKQSRDVARSPGEGASFPDLSALRPTASVPIGRNTVRAYPIEHHSEFLARHLDQLPKRQGEGEKIVYHDPCYLGRYRNVYDEPRDVVSRFGTLAEPPHRANDRSVVARAAGWRFWVRRRGSGSARSARRSWWRLAQA